MNDDIFENQLTKRDSIKQHTLSLTELGAQRGEPLKVNVADIRVGQRLVPEDPAVVAQLMASFERDRQIQPVLVRQVGKQLELIDGMNRLRAAQCLDWDQLTAYVMCNVSDEEAKAFEAISNRHRRQKLSALDRALSDVTILEHVMQKVQQVAAPRGGKQPKEQFIAKTARELGVSPEQIARSRKIATIDPFVRQKVRRYGLENNQSVLLEIAKSSRDAVGQSATLARLLSARQGSKDSGTPEDQHFEQSQSSNSEDTSRDESRSADEGSQQDFQTPVGASSSDASTSSEHDSQDNRDICGEMTAICLLLPKSMQEKMTLVQPDSRVKLVCIGVQDDATGCALVIQEVCLL